MSKIRILKNEETEDWMQPIFTEYLELFNDYCALKRVNYSYMPKRAINALLLAAVTEKYPNTPGKPCHNGTVYDAVYRHLIQQAAAQRESEIIRQGSLLPPEFQQNTIKQ